MAVDPSDRRVHHQLLRLVDNYAAEELIRERAIEELKNKRTDLASEVESAFGDLERLKMTRTAAAEEARELRIELETMKAAVNFKQEKLSSQQQEIFKTNALLKNLEEEEMCTSKMQSAHSGPSLQPDYQSTGSESANLENLQSSCDPRGEPGIVTASRRTKDDAGVRHEEQVSELLREICTAESVLLPVRENLDCQQEKLRDRRHKHAAYIENIGQATQDLTSTRNQSEKLERQVASLTTDLQDMYICPQCGTDNLGHATG